MNSALEVDQKTWEGFVQHLLTEGGYDMVTNNTPTEYTLSVCSDDFCYALVKVEFEAEDFWVKCLPSSIIPRNIPGVFHFSVDKQAYNKYLLTTSQS